LEVYVVLKIQDAGCWVVTQSNFVITDDSDLKMEAEFENIGNHL
jgi:hypothetical protein